MRQVRATTLALRVPAAAQPKSHVDQRNERGHLNQRPDNARQRLPRVQPKYADGHRNGQLKVVASSTLGTMMPVTLRQLGEPLAADYRAATLQQQRIVPLPA